MVVLKSHDGKYFHCETGLSQGATIREHSNFPLFNTLYLVLHDHVANHGEEIRAVEGKGPHVFGQLINGLLHSDRALKQRFLHPQFAQHIRVVDNFPGVKG